MSLAKSGEFAKLVNLIRKSGVFDPNWYLRQAPDCLTSDLDPIEHYLTIGADRNLDPGPTFSTRFYRETHPKLDARGISPLVHALRNRRRDGGWHRGDRRRALYAARIVAEAGQMELAEQLAADTLPDDHKSGLHLLRANRLSRSNDPEGWCREVNAYLSQDQLAQIALRDGTSLFDRLCAPTAQPCVGLADSPTITIILAAYNAADTLPYALRSIREQSWSNFELIAVNDCSTDNTGSVLETFAMAEPRATVLHLPANAGPYVARNIALKCAKGDLITCHDADDWAHPERLERQVKRWIEVGRPAVSAVSMLRAHANGYFAHLLPERQAQPDGARTMALFSLLYDAEFLRNRLGAWDCARFGADREMKGRSEVLTGRPVAQFSDCCFLALDSVGSLTNNPEFGIHPDYGATQPRVDYRQAWKAWHTSLDPNSADGRLTFPPKRRYFSAPSQASVRTSIIKEVVDWASGLEII